MSKSIPSVQKFMTTQPHTVDKDEALDKAYELLSQQKIRHLPVTDRDRLIGVISDRDLKLAMSLHGADIRKMTAEDIAVADPYQTGPDTPLDEVAAQMSESHYGCVVVTQNEKVVGILTTVDICRALAEVLQTRFHQTQ